MNVEDVSVGPDWPLRRVMQQINKASQGIAVVVGEGRQALATVTDGDIRRAILDGIDLDLPVQALLDRRPASSRSGPITALQGTGPAELLRLMRENTIRHVPIIDRGGRLVDVAVLHELVEERELPVTAVVMAGGYGTRLRPLTEELPKPMLRVGDRPLLELIIEQLSRAGVRHVNLTTHYKRDLISRYFGDGRDFGVELHYVEEDQPLGTAGALSLLEVTEQPILVINGDILTTVDFRAMLEFHREQGADMTIAVRQHEFRIPYGVVEIEGATVKAISEKPVVRHLINAGMYLLSPEVCRYIPAAQPYTMPDLIRKLVEEGHRVVSFPVEEYWLDIGHQADYAQAQADAEKEGFG